MFPKDVVGIVYRLLWNYSNRDNMSEYRKDYKLSTRFVESPCLLEYKGLPAVQWRRSSKGLWRNMYNFIRNDLLSCEMPKRY